ncbi:TPA: hypothetical protein DIS56_04375 [Candidatus Saccharibacteria bacterium]|nr:MAG: hypothetical protein UX30_C0005G0077 [Candidatus Saccharibacteria bacterium GW2011_GWA2_46_10]OGL35106.1 MAG: hypothetical protein A3F05_03415 [Candidatus Saccharibacteria bacterium RIFCSPHIGHO2_12_FULL_47_17]HCM52328.1 hypothetical protein [Candidatus Saccharibacteria bacterium]
MNKVEKLLQKLDPKTRARVEQALLHLANNRLEELDIKKIKGTNDIFRIRVGRHRIVIRQVDQKFNLITIAKRDEKTYKSF